MKKLSLLLFVLIYSVACKNLGGTKRTTGGAPALVQPGGSPGAANQGSAGGGSGSGMGAADDSEKGLVLSRAEAAHKILVDVSALLPNNAFIAGAIDRLSRVKMSPLNESHLRVFCYYTSVTRYSLIRNPNLKAQGEAKNLEPILDKAGLCFQTHAAALAAERSVLLIQRAFPTPRHGEFKGVLNDAEYAAVSQQDTAPGKLCAHWDGLKDKIAGAVAQGVIAAAAGDSLMADLFGWKSAGGICFGL